jgi:sulfate adenylyltransferase subunit 1 (EFTu-like GTPase family)
VAPGAATNGRPTPTFAGVATELDIHDVTFIPILALHGDNMVERSNNLRRRARRGRPGL